MANYFKDNGVSNLAVRQVNEVIVELQIKKDFNPKAKLFIVAPWPIAIQIETNKVSTLLSAPSINGQMFLPGGPMLKFYWKVCTTAKKKKA